MFSSKMIRSKFMVRGLNFDHEIDHQSELGILLKRVENEILESILKMKPKKAKKKKTQNSIF